MTSPNLGRGEGDCLLLRVRLGAGRRVAALCTPTSTPALRSGLRSPRPTAAEGGTLGKGICMGLQFIVSSATTELKSVFQMRAAFRLTALWSSNRRQKEAERETGSRARSWGRRGWASGAAGTWAPAGLLVPHPHHRGSEGAESGDVSQEQGAEKPKKKGRGGQGFWPRDSVGTRRLSPGACA